MQAQSEKWPETAHVFSQTGGSTASVKTYYFTEFVQPDCRILVLGLPLHTKVLSLAHDHLKGFFMNVLERKVDEQEAMHRRRCFIVIPPDVPINGEVELIPCGYCDSFGKRYHLFEVSKRQPHA